MSEKVNSKNKTTNSQQAVSDTAEEPQNQSQSAKKVGPITTKLNELEKRVKNERGIAGSMGDTLRDKAMAVILRNPRSKEWDEYMKLFNFTEEELNQLVPSATDHAKNEALAYLIGGGVCGGTSVDPAPPGLFGHVLRDDPEAIERKD